MTSKRHIVTLFLLLLTAGTARAQQWYGNVDAAGGFGWMKSLRGDLFEGMDPYISHSLGEGNVGFGYRSPKFQWSAKVNAKYEPKTAERYRFEAVVGEEEKDSKLHALIKVNNSRPLDAGFRTDFTWTPAAKQRYSAWLNFRYQSDSDDAEIANAAIRSLDYTEEWAQRLRLTYTGGFNSSNAIGRRTLQSSLTLEFKADGRHNQWNTLGIADSDDLWTKQQIEEKNLWSKIYRLTPFSGNLSADGVIHLKDTVLRSRHKLILDPGIRGNVKYTYDENSGATMLNPLSGKGEWKDSTSIHEQFFFFTLQAEPYVAADYTYGPLRVKADYGLQVYVRRLQNEKHMDTPTTVVQHFTGNSSFTWKIHPSHELGLSHSRSVKHPSYLQTCSFERPGAFINQIWRGNTELNSTITSTLSLDYKYRRKRFSAGLSTFYTRKLDEVDQTYSMEKIDGREYKVFTWMNSSNSHLWGITPSLSWAGKWVDAGLNVKYNHTYRIAELEQKTQKTDEWRIQANLLLKLGKGWSIGADMNYKSPTMTLHTLITSYWTLNARVEKKFKDVTLYLQGKDLLEHMQKNEYTSVYGNEVWVEQIYQNRRIIILGVKWNFKL